MSIVNFWISRVKGFFEVCGAVGFGELGDGGGIDEDEPLLLLKEEGVTRSAEEEGDIKDDGVVLEEATELPLVVADVAAVGVGDGGP
jgi:hypothetical protein